MRSTRSARSHKRVVNNKRDEVYPESEVPQTSQIIRVMRSTQSARSRKRVVKNKLDEA